MTVKVINGLHDGKRRAYSGRELSWNFRHAPLSARCLHPHADRHRDPGQRVSRRGPGASFMLVASNVAISLLFFLHGARLSTDAIVAGVKDLRLHALILAAPSCCSAAGTRAARAVPGAADAGAVAGRAVCLHAVLHGAVVHRLHVHGARQRARRHLRGHRFEPAGHGADAAAGGRAAAPPGRRSRLADAGRILLQLLLPFALGSLLRPWIGAWAQRNSRVLSKVDRSSILLAVYTAFSEAVAQGIWHAFPPLDLATMVLVNAVLLGAVLLITTWGARRLGLSRRTRSRWCSVARRNRWPRAFRWRPCCSARRRWASWCCPDDLPPDAADGLRGAGAALCRPGSAGGRDAGGRRRAWSRPRRMAPSQGQHTSRPAARDGPRSGGVQRADLAGGAPIDRAVAFLHIQRREAAVLAGAAHAQAGVGLVGGAVRAHMMRSPARVKKLPSQSSSTPTWAQRFR